MESQNLTLARAALSQFEASISKDNAIRFLSEGLDRLEEISVGELDETPRAQTIADRYVAIALEHVKNVLMHENATEPELLHSHKIMLVLSEYRFGDANAIKSTAFDAVTHLFNKLYTGYSDHEKLEILERLKNERSRRT